MTPLQRRKQVSDELKSFEEIERAILVRKLERCLELLKEKDILIFFQHILLLTRVIAIPGLLTLL